MFHIVIMTPLPEYILPYKLRIYIHAFLKQLDLLIEDKLFVIIPIHHD